MGLFYSQHKGFGDLLDAAVAKMDEVEAGITGPKEASTISSISSATPASHRPPTTWGSGYALHQRRDFFVTLKTLIWLFTSAPPDIRSLSLGLLGSGKQHQPAPLAT